MKNTQKYFILLLMLILLVPSNIWGQETKKEIIVKGVVEDDLGPIIGASVVAKNQAGVGVITNTEGKFSLKVGPYDEMCIRDRVRCLCMLDYLVKQDLRMVFQRRLDLISLNV